ncbi:MAG: PH domain-containing protein [Anaerolineales bacterium]|jgi:uncharacterized membrane protein YdbT with pleckstrin-like domain
MGFIERSLLPDEKVISRAKMHWAIFIFPVLIFLFGLCLTLMIHVSPQESSTNDLNSLLFGLFCIWFIPALGAIAFITVVLAYLTTEFAVTDKRIIAKTGILRQHSLEIMINKVESIDVNQPILGRILNYGTIIVVGSGGTKQSFKNIDKPMELRQQINIQISKSKQ